MRVSHHLTYSVNHSYVCLRARKKCSSQSWPVATQGRIASQNAMQLFLRITTISQASGPKTMNPKSGNEVGATPLKGIDHQSRNEAWKIGQPYLMRRLCKLDSNFSKALEEPAQPGFSEFTAFFWPFWDWKRPKLCFFWDKKVIWHYFLYELNTTASGPLSIRTSGNYYSAWVY